MYNYGSEAFEYDFEAEVIEKAPAKNLPAKKTFPVLNNRKIKRKIMKVWAIIGVILTVILVREAQIDKLCGEITTKRDKVANLSAIVTEKEMYLSQSLDLNMVEDIATTRLGMKLPDQSQIVYIQFENRDGGEILGTKQEDDTSVKAVISKAKTLLEYLY